MRTEDHTQAFEWYHFQWSWVTSNPYFKVMPSFIVEYRRNETRCKHSYNGKLNGTYTCPTQGCHFEWPQVIWQNILVITSANVHLARWQNYTGLVFCKSRRNSGVTASMLCHWKPQESSLWRWFHIVGQCHMGPGVALPGCDGGLSLGDRPCWLSVSLCW